MKKLTGVFVVNCCFATQVFSFTEADRNDLLKYISTSKKEEEKKASHINGSARSDFTRAAMKNDEAQNAKYVPSAPSQVLMDLKASALQQLDAQAVYLRKAELDKKELESIKNESFRNIAPGDKAARDKQIKEIVAEQKGLHAIDKEIVAESNRHVKQVATNYAITSAVVAKEGLRKGFDVFWTRSKNPVNAAEETYSELFTQHPEWMIKESMRHYIEHKWHDAMQSKLEQEKEDFLKTTKWYRKK